MKKTVLKHMWKIHKKDLNKIQNNIEKNISKRDKCENVKCRWGISKVVC